MNRWRTGRAYALAALAAAAAASTSSAEILGGAVTGGTSGGMFVEVSPPPSEAGPDAFDSPDLIAFDELQDVVLIAPLPVSPTRMIPAGTTVSSHYVAFDPATPSTIEGTVLFDEPIIAIIGDPLALDATEAIFGIATVEYTVGPAIGPDPSDPPDLFLPAPTDRQRLLVTAGANSPGDQVRVLTGFIIPEPASAVMVAVCLGACATLRQRQLN